MFVDSTINKTICYIKKLQQENGSISEESDWCALSPAEFILTMYLIHHSISPEKKSGLYQYFLHHQLEDGSWPLHREGEGSVFVTLLSYIALRILGCDKENPMCKDAHRFLRHRHNREKIPALAQYWLAMLSLLPWSKVAAFPPETILLPRFFPWHPLKLHIETRCVFFAMAFIYGRKISIKPNELMNAIADELEIHTIKTASKSLLSDFQPTKTNVILNKLAAFYELIHIKTLRKKSIKVLLENIVKIQESTHYYGCNSTVFLLNLIILRFSNEELLFEKSLARHTQWIYQLNKQELTCLNQENRTWDSVITTQALAHCRSSPQVSVLLKKLLIFLSHAQIKENFLRDKNHFYDMQKGGFCNGIKQQNLPSSACTAEALLAIQAILPGKNILRFYDKNNIEAAVDFILSRQNKDGGFSMLEKKRSYGLIEHINPLEIFDTADPSYADTTASCIKALVSIFPFVDTKHQEQIKHSGEAGKNFLVSCQQKDGSFEGHMGIHFIYGTSMAVCALSKIGEGPDNPIVQKACQWILSKQLTDGGWGESYKSQLLHQYIPHEKSQVVMTSWALISLLEAKYFNEVSIKAIYQGIQLLLHRQLPNGNWPQESVAASFCSKGFIDDHLYKTCFPLWALALYKKQFKHLTAQKGLS